jgi:hypothetical protein
MVQLYFARPKQYKGSYYLLASTSMRDPLSAAGFEGDAP